MRKLIITISFLCFQLAGFCQSANVLLDVRYEQLDDSEYKIHVSFTLAKGWHVYAHNQEPSGIEIDFENPSIKLLPSTIDQTPLTITDPIFDNQKLTVYQGTFTLTQPIKIEGEIPSTLKFAIKGFAANVSEFLPIEEIKEIKLREENDLQLSSVTIDKPVNDCGDNQGQSKSLLTIFLIGFGGGLLALLTPCIFPMIPVTVSYFGNKSKSRRESIRNASLYGLFIFLIYLIASAPFHLIGNINPQIFNIISTNPWVNIFFFFVFILFALSFFGLFEIRLPSAISNAAGSRSGIFFMALTLAIVSFSCTGIILGSLLVNALSSGGSAWQLTAGIGGFGLALALPFALFALFPQWLSKFPKSGDWLSTVKVSLAFIELALAIKFLSNADLVEHWGILKRETFIAIWVLIALSLTIYLVRRRVYSFATLTILLTAYMTSGLFGFNLKLLSGFPPPTSYSFFGDKNAVEPDVVNDYEKAVELSKKSNKPILIDFTGWACVNCRKMEELIWTKPAIKELIRDNYILVSLYVDDRKKLPDGRTAGEKWASFQADNFKQVTQPLYVILSPDEVLMNHPVGYTPNEDTYKEWLQCGIDAFKDKKLSQR